MTSLSGAWYTCRVCVSVAGRFWPALSRLSVYSRLGCVRLHVSKPDHKVTVPWPLVTFVLAV